MRRARFARAEGVGLPEGEARAAKRSQEVCASRRDSPRVSAEKRTCCSQLETPRQRPTPKIGEMGRPFARWPLARGGEAFESRLGAPKSAFLSLSFRFQFPAAAFFRRFLFRFLFRFSAANHHQTNPSEKNNPLTTTKDARRLTRRRAYRRECDRGRPLSVQVLRVRRKSTTVRTVGRESRWDGERRTLNAASSW